MRRIIWAMGMLMAAPVWAGDASGFDPTAIDTCLKDGGICADAGMTACEEFVAREHSDLSQVDRTLGCIDASHQAWEARLGEHYDALLARMKTKSAEAETALRQMERDWITFRDARCAFETQAFGHGTGGAVEQPRCVRDETARHDALLRGLLKDTAE